MKYLLELHVKRKRDYVDINMKDFLLNIYKEEVEREG